MDFFKSHCLTDPTMVSVSPTSFNIVGRSMLDVFCGVGCCWIKSEFACAQTFLFDSAPVFSFPHLHPKPLALEHNKFPSGFYLYV